MELGKVIYYVGHAYEAREGCRNAYTMYIVEDDMLSLCTKGMAENSSLLWSYGRPATGYYCASVTLSCHRTLVDQKR